MADLPSRRSERYPLLAKRLEASGRTLPDPAKREPRCGPWVEREDGSFECQKCGDIEVRGSGPLGF